MFSTRRGLARFLSIGFVVLFGWLALLSTGQSVHLERTTYAGPAQSPGTDIFPSWIISPSQAILTPRPVPSPIQYTKPFTYSLTPSEPWDTDYIKVGSILQDASSRTYRMYYESDSIILSSFYTNGDALQQLRVGSAIGIAISTDGINWTRPTLDPVFTAQAGAWDSSYVGSPRVIYDGNIYRMFYVGSNVTGPKSGINAHFTNDATAYIGVAESSDGLNWTRAGRTSPVFATTAGSWESFYTEPSSVRIENDTLKMYYTAADVNDPNTYRTGLAYINNFASVATKDLKFTEASGNPITVNGNSDRIKSAIAARVAGNLFLWYVNNFSGSDLIYQAYGNSEVSFTRDPDRNIIKPIGNTPNDLVSQVDIGGIQFGSNSSFITSTIWFSGLSGTNLSLNAFRAVAPNLVPPPTGASTPVVLPTRSAATPTPTPGQPGLPPPVPAGGPSAFLTPTPGEGNYPPFFDLWRRTDEPVRQGFAQRSWIYGAIPTGFRYLRERYDEGSRLVLYHDKARMEASPNGGTTNGLLAKELISGLMQVGDNKFEPRTAGNEAIAGDAIELNPSNPAYYSLRRVASLNNDNRAAVRSGQGVVETINRNGDVGTDNNTASYGVTYNYYEPILGHNIASVFWNYFQQRGTVLNSNGYYNDLIFDWIPTVGLPLTEPYWTKAVVGGRQVDVLVQAFERRVLTYTPSNNDAFKVEMGNVGRHYFRWRYNLQS